MVESLLPQEAKPIDMEKCDNLDNIQFDLSPDKSRGKLVLTVHGEKGAGKTTATFLVTNGRIGGFPNGRTNVISFDNKTKITKEQYFPLDNITVWDGKQHYRENPDLCTKSGMITYKFLQKLIQSWQKDAPDWIVFDGFTIMSVILEMAMRYKHGLQPSQGISNLNVWKDRARYIQDLHNLACRVAKYGVAYTTYSEKAEIVEAGTVISKVDVPKYIDVIMQETDVVLHATKAQGKEGDLFFLRVESTKFRTYLDTEGKPIPKCPTTLEQGRMFNISKLADIPPIKPMQTVTPSPAPVAQAEVPKMTEAPKMEPAKQIEPAKPIEQAKPTVEAPKPIDVPKVEEPTKKWEVPNLLAL